MTTEEEKWCTAQHPLALQGCFDAPNHEGKHWSWDSAADPTAELETDDYYPYHRRFWWTDAPLTFTLEEIGILLVALQPVQQFFPDLKAKLEAAQEAAQ